jgi:subtilisin family serine protease
MRVQFSVLLAAAATTAMFLPACLTLDMEGTGTTAAPLVVVPAAQRIPGEHIVVFHDRTAAASIAAAQARVSQASAKNRIIHTYSVIPGFAAVLDDALLAELRRNPDVAYIQENGVVRISAVSASPADGIDRVDQRPGHDGLYDDHGRTGAGVHIYVIDTGINTMHDEFAGRLDDGFTAIHDGRGVEDCHGHGTHVSSTAAGTRYGIAKQARIHPVRVLDCIGSGTFGGVIAGMDAVSQDCPLQTGRCVANLSLGGGLTPAVNLAVANAVDSGVTVVVAAGNDNVDACTVSPASEPKAITVAAINDADTRAPFSNWGQCVDIFAPGVTILGASIGGRLATAVLDGTSMASPHVAGVAAQYLSSNPTATPAQVELNVKGSASLDCVANPRGSPNLLLFNDLSQGNYTCSAPAPSCEGLCGGVSDGCFCDPGCVDFGDCCHDYPQFCE